MNFFQAVGDLLTGTQRATDAKGHKHIVQQKGDTVIYKEFDQSGNLVESGTASLKTGGWTSYNSKYGAKNDNFDNRKK